ncbi:MAG: hypothetical protein IPM17_03835 [Verrucomicrobia bacterium]|jgi:hypothetical protein|nr:hypothetical protein [Verrucomicrobiota bacterium]
MFVPPETLGLERVARLARPSDKTEMWEKAVFLQQPPHGGFTLSIQSGLASFPAENWFLIGGALLPLLGFGLLLLLWAIGGIRRGQFHYSGGWLHRRHDGWIFWAVTLSCAASGLAIMLAATWLALELFR